VLIIGCDYHPSVLQIAFVFVLVALEHLIRPAQVPLNINHVRLGYIFFNRSVSPCSSRRLRSRFWGIGSRKSRTDGWHRATRAVEQHFTADNKAHGQHGRTHPSRSRARRQPSNCAAT
jgi:hypothetical protein